MSSFDARVKHPRVVVTCSFLLIQYSNHVVLCLLRTARIWGEGTREVVGLARVVGREVLKINCEKNIPY